jgi:hypothetical protein
MTARRRVISHYNAGDMSNLHKLGRILHRASWRSECTIQQIDRPYAAEQLCRELAAVTGGCLKLSILMNSSNITGPEIVPYCILVAKPYKHPSFTQQLPLQGVLKVA